MRHEVRESSGGMTGHDAALAIDDSGAHQKWWAMGDDGHRETAGARNEWLSSF